MRPVVALQLRVCNVRAAFAAVVRLLAAVLQAQRMAARVHISGAGRCQIGSSQALVTRPASDVHRRGGFKCHRLWVFVL